MRRPIHILVYILSTSSVVFTSSVSYDAANNNVFVGISWCCCQAFINQPLTPEFLGRPTYCWRT